MSTSSPRRTVLPPTILVLLAAMAVPQAHAGTPPPVTENHLITLWGSNGWMWEEPFVQLVCVHQSSAGCRTIYWKLDEEPWKSGNGNDVHSFTVRGEGFHVLGYFSEDYDGVREPVQVEVYKVDLFAPRGEILRPLAGHKYVLDVGVSGVAGPTTVAGTLTTQFTGRDGISGVVHMHASSDTGTYASWDYDRRAQVTEEAKWKSSHCQVLRATNHGISLFVEDESGRTATVGIGNIVRADCTAV